MKKIRTILSLLFAFCLCSPVLANNKLSYLSTNKIQFLDHIASRAQENNQAIVNSRAKLIQLYHEYQQKKFLNTVKTSWIKKLAHEYQIPAINLQQNSTWHTLLTRVDIVPISLVLAQAINESAWGTSRFAKKGNNYFGIWCFSPGCGIVPNDRETQAKHEIKSFSNTHEAVEYYMHTLNTNKAYDKLRLMRARMRAGKEYPDGITLASGLQFYSSRGNAYVQSIRQIISYYHLSEYNRPQEVKSYSLPDLFQTYI